ncbi:MAG: hypothetical protein ABIT81_15515 [Ferruginibacter sp.]
MDEEDEWKEYSAKQLSKAYLEDEPEYSVLMIKEPNPVYKND